MERTVNLGMPESRRVGDHYDAAPQQYPEIAGDRLSSLDCRTFQRFVSLYPARATVVDAGCGTGRVGRYMKRRLNPPLTVYLDLSQRELDIARKLDSAAGDGPSAFVRADVLNMPASGLSFCASHGVIHHTPEPLRALDQLAASLAPGGILYLAIYARSWYAHLYRMFGVLRYARVHRAEWLVRLAYAVYWPLRWTLRVREAGSARRDFNIRASFEDFVMTPYAHFFDSHDLCRQFAELGLEVIEHEKLNYGALHSYVLRKTA